MRALGVDPADVRWVVLTHFHTDHAGGLGHFPDSEIVASRVDYRGARGLLGRARGFLPQHWPEGFAPALTDLAEQLMLAGRADGVSPDPARAAQTLARIRRLAAERPTIYLPTHDPESPARLERGQTTVAG